MPDMRVRASASTPTIVSFSAQGLAEELPRLVRLLAEVREVFTVPDAILGPGLAIDADLVALSAATSVVGTAGCSRVEAPALVIHGAQDRIIPAAQGRQLAEALGKATWVAVEGAGHNDISGVDAYWQAIAAFLAPRTGAAD